MSQNGKRSAIDLLLYGNDRGAEKLTTGQPPLLGTWEVARYLGIERSRVARWLTELENGKAVIEPPDHRTKAGPFWTLPKIERKAKQMFRQDKGRRPRDKAELDKWLARRRTTRTRRERELLAAT